MRDDYGTKHKAAHERFVELLTRKYVTFHAAPRPPALASAEATVQAGLHGGTLGWGVSAGYDVSESASVRALFNRLDYGYEQTRSGNRFKGELEFQSFVAIPEDRRSVGDGTGRSVAPILTTSGDPKLRLPNNTRTDGTGGSDEWKGE